MAEGSFINPFPGLRPFQTDEDWLFFGRERQTAELLARLGEYRFLAVVGTSGSGKSSLVRAGLIPALHRGTMGRAGSSWEMVVLRPGGSPLRSLARGFRDEGLYDADDPETEPRLVATLAHSGRGLVEAYRQSEIEEDTNLLVVIDQFEEVFRFQQRDDDCHDEADTFVDLLLEASAQTECPIYVALTVRSDDLGDCSQFRGLAAAVNDGEYLIPRLDRDELRRAIEGPVNVGGGKISPRLVQQLLNDVGDDLDQLPVLQHALMRTWERWATENAKGEPIDLVHYDAVGRMAEALSRHADEVFESLPTDQGRALAARVFRALTEKGADNRGRRRPTRVARLEEIAGTTREELLAVLDAFRQPGVTFLMPGARTELQDRTVIDISHESLMRVWARLSGWVEEEFQSARVYRRLAESATIWKDGRAGLYHDPDLQLARSWREEWNPNAAWAALYGGGFEEAMIFLEESQATAEKAEQEREAARQRELDQAREIAEAQRLRAAEQKRAAGRLRWLVGGLAVALVAAVIALLMAVSAR